MANVKKYVSNIESREAFQKAIKLGDEAGNPIGQNLMTDPIKVFGNVGSPYTQKILSLLRYRNIPYSVSWGDVVQNLSFLNVEPPKPVLLPTMVFKDDEGSNICKTDTTPIIRYLEELYKEKSVIPPSPCLLYTSPSPRDAHESRMPSSA